MSDILCVTNRKLCCEEFSLRLEKIAAARPAGMILREKDLSEEDYRLLARWTMELCKTHGVPCILHTFVQTAMELGAEAIHLPLPVLRRMAETEKAYFTTLGASCHSVEDAMEAQRLGCTYITAGHIFVTDCKKGAAPRGLDFLRSVCEAVDIPVYAIGGISGENIEAVRGAGASGACVMSGVMRCTSVEDYLDQLKKGEHADAISF